MVRRLTGLSIPRENSTRSEAEHAGRGMWAGSYVEPWAISGVHPVRRAACGVFGRRQRAPLKAERHVQSVQHHDQPGRHHRAVPRGEPLRRQPPASARRVTHEEINASLTDCHQRTALPPGAASTANALPSSARRGDVETQSPPPWSRARHGWDSATDLADVLATGAVGTPVCRSLADRRALI
jgi:hypothetical protein